MCSPLPCFVALFLTLAAGAAMGQAAPGHVPQHPPEHPGAKAGVQVGATAGAKEGAKAGAKEAAVAGKPRVTAKAKGKPVHRAAPVVAAPAVAPSPAPAEAEKPAEQTKGTNTGNPLPRFATLRSDEVNLRTGPGTRYPIDWVYKRKDLPVMIEREFDAWRLVRDSDGVKGWVHQATLAPRRTAVVVGGEQVLRSDPRGDGAAVARLKPGVIVRLRSCEATSDWCQATVADYRGWIRRTEIWGVFPGEAIQ